jgi:ATP-binding cassette subfamily C protein
MNMTFSKAYKMFTLFKELFNYKPFNMLLTLMLMLIKNISAGISLLLILPLLQVSGFLTGPQGNYGITALLVKGFALLHLPLNLSSVLLSYIVIISTIAGIHYAEQLLSTTLQHNYIHHLREMLYRHIAYTQWLFFIKQKMPDLVHRLTTQVQTVSSANFQLLHLINHLILLFVYITLACLLSWQMTCLAIGCGVLLLSFMLPLHKRTSQSGHYYLTKNRTMTQAIIEQLAALKMIKSAGAEERFVAKTLEISSLIERENKRLIQMTAATKLVYSIGSVMVFSLLLYVAMQILKLPAPSLILLLLIFVRILPMVSTTQQCYQRLLHQLPAYEDIKKLLEQMQRHQETFAVPYDFAEIGVVASTAKQSSSLDAMKDCAKVTGLPRRDAPCNSTLSFTLAFQKEIRLNQVSFAYIPNHFIIKKLSLRLKKNTTTAIIGPSGVGKSTLADLIVGLLEPTEGEIYIDNQRLTPKNNAFWRQSIAYVTQDNFLFNTSLRENLELFSGPQPDEKLWEILKAVDANFAIKFAQGLDTPLGDRGVYLSGGERQRIAIARALLMQPQLLILDESTNALDKESIQNIQTILKTLQGTTTILIISHQIEMSEFADQKIGCVNNSTTELLFQ